MNEYVSLYKPDSLHSNCFAIIVTTCSICARVNCDTGTCFTKSARMSFKCVLDTRAHLRDLFAHATDVTIHDDAHHSLQLIQLPQARKIREISRQFIIVVGERRSERSLR